MNVYTSGDPGEAPDQLTDQQNAFAIDWSFGKTPDLWVLTVKADAGGFVSSTCARQFPKQVALSGVARMANERMTRTRQLARVE